MNRRIAIVAAGAVIAAIALGGAGVAVAAGGGDEQEVPITGPELARASAAALTETSGGRVTDTEVGDEESYYEVEVTLEDGSQVDVQLDRDFVVVGRQADDHGGDAGDAGDADD